VTLDADRIVAIFAESAPRIGEQIRFLLEIDELKAILRRSVTTGENRRENSAEHSWHLAMFAAVLAEHASPDVDVARAIRILLVHDIVEIDADDTYIYDTEALARKAELETAAAERIFGLLPDDQADEFRALWDEYEDCVTPTARFAYAIDRLQPLLLNAAHDGRSWRDHDIDAARVIAVNSPIADGLPGVWPIAEEVIAEAVATGALRAVPSHLG
jgi:putative hydrolase of HD superfamily